MNRSETAAVIAAMNLADPRVEPLQRRDDPRVEFFHSVLERYPAAQAMVAIREYAESSHNVAMQVGNVVEGIKKIRSRNLEQIPASGLVPPDGLEPGRFPQWAQLARQAVKDGAPDVEAASEWADEQMRRMALANGSEARIERRASALPGSRPLSLPKDQPGQARFDVVAGEMVVTERGDGEES